MVVRTRDPGGTVIEKIREGAGADTVEPVDVVIVILMLSERTPDTQGP